MEASGVIIESLYHEKILLYQELLDALDRERQTIIDIDVDALWKISEQKNKISQKIGVIHRRMLKLLDDLSISHEMDTNSYDAIKIFALMPQSIKERLHRAQMTLLTLKNDLKARLEENRRHVEEYLSVFDELIGVITHAGLPKPLYDRRRCAPTSTTHLFLNREV
jgi:hypothetical protein